METKRLGNTYKVNPLLITINWEDNTRVDYGDIESIKKYIRANGTDKLAPIKVRKVHGKDEYVLCHGYRRMKAITEMIEAGEKVDFVIVIVVTNKYTEEDALVDHIAENAGKPLNALEQAETFLRLKNTAGKNQSQIARAIGKTPAYVSTMLKLAKASDEVKQVVRDGFISTSLVLLIMKKHKENAEEVIMKEVNRMLEKATNPEGDGGEEKVTSGNVQDSAVRVSRNARIFQKVVAYTTENNMATKGIQTKLDKVSAILEVFDNSKGKSEEELLDELVNCI